jgi:cysteinyl-tRNA synthetase
MDEFNTVLDIFEERGELDSDIQALVDARETARKAKDFKKSDEIRNQLKEKGIILEDSKDGVVWKRG